MANANKVTFVQINTLGTVKCRNPTNRASLQVLDGFESRSMGHTGILIVTASTFHRISESVDEQHITLLALSRILYANGYLKKKPIAIRYVSRLGADRG